MKNLKKNTFITANSKNTKKIMALSTAALGLLAGFSVLDGVNNALFDSSPVGQLTVKLWLSGYLFHITREIFKVVNEDKMKVLSGIVIAAAVSQIVANYLTLDRSISVYGSVFPIACGTAAIFSAKTLRNYFIPKTSEEVSSTGYKINSANTAVFLSLQSIVNRLIDNKLAIGSKAFSSGPSAFSDYIFSGLTAHTAKGSIRNVDAYWKHYGAMIAFPSTALVSDCLVNAIADGIENKQPNLDLIGKTSSLAFASIVGHLTKSFVYSIIGEQPFTQESGENHSNLSTTGKVGALAAWQFALTMIVAIANKETEGGLKTILCQMYSISNRKLQKAAIKINDNVMHRLQAVGVLFTVALVASVAVGFIMDENQNENSNEPIHGQLKTAFDWANRHLGPTVAITVVGLFTDGVPRSFSKIKKDQESSIESIEAHSNESIDLEGQGETKEGIDGEIPTIELNTLS